jgi:probable F420-dependent oxidoreductase
MQIGIVYPQTEYPSNPDLIRQWTLGAEAFGYRHILAYDHVLGAEPVRSGGWSGPYTYRDPFQEPFLLFSWMAALTTRIGFITGVIVLPQRQTALVAKQAATLDILCGGRFRLGVGIGWNRVEYEALGSDFSTRGRRIEEQVQLLQRLWTQEIVNFEGEWHRVDAAGLNPLPEQRPIPVWFGGHAEVVLERIARSGDGWLPNYTTPMEAAQSLAILDGLLADAGRTRKDVGIEPRLLYGDGDVGRWRELVAAWEDAGATHLTLNTMRSELDGADGHLAAMERFAELIL